MINLLILGIITIVISYIIIGKYVEFANNRIKQPFLKDGPEHTQKQGTPTMGGVSVFGIYIVVSFIFILLYNIWNVVMHGVDRLIFFNIFIILIATVGYFIIGFIDDYNKVKFSENTKGLTPLQKLILQLFISLIIIFCLYKVNFNIEINLYIFNAQINLGILYYIFIPFLFLAMTNATNLTDGVDGLLTTNAIISILGLTVIAFLKQDMAIVTSNIFLISILLAFLIYNKNPAKIFLGDVGSLTIGSYLTIVAILLKVEFLLLAFAMIYFIETLSVMLQVGYFKYTKKKYGEGKRLLLMAPFHHHLERKGYSENKIVLIFSIVNILFSIFGIIIYIV